METFLLLNKKLFEIHLQSCGAGIWADARCFITVRKRREIWAAGASRVAGGGLEAALFKPRVFTVWCWTSDPPAFNTHAAALKQQVPRLCRRHCGVRARLGISAYFES